MCACDLRYSSSKDNSFHRFPVQGKSGYYKAVVTCLYCEGFEVSSSRKKSHRRIAMKKGKCLEFVESSVKYIACQLIQMDSLIVLVSADK